MRRSQGKSQYGKRQPLPDIDCTRLVAGSIRRWLTRASKLQRKSTRKPNGPETGALQMGVPEIGSSLQPRGPKLGPLQMELNRTQAPTQACEAAAQVVFGAIQTWRRTAQPQLRAAYSKHRLKQRVLRSENKNCIW
jgi:hypothetical protein